MPIGKNLQECFQMRVFKIGRIQYKNSRIQYSCRYRSHRRNIKGVYHITNQVLNLLNLDVGLGNYDPGLMYICILSFHIQHQNGTNQIKKQQFKTTMSFGNSLLKIGWPTPKPVYNTHKPTGLRILTGKKYHRIKLQHLQKVQIWAFGLLNSL